MSVALSIRKMTWLVPAQRRAVDATLILLALLCSVPYLVPAHRYPLTVFDGELASGCLLASAMIVAALAQPARVAMRWPLPTIVLVLVAIAAAQSVLGMLHYTYALTSLLIFLCALVAAYLLGRWIIASDLRARAMHAIATGVVVGALLQVAVQVLQMLDVRALPTWLVFPPLHGISSRRPYGNLAQPNLLATYFIWATLAAAYLVRSGAPVRPLLAAAGTFFCGLALTGSRMGSLFGLALMVLALMPGALSPERARDRVRAVIVLALGYALGLAMTRYFLVDANGTMATALERYAEGSIGQRLSMWMDAGRIALANPWFGAGVGEYGGAQYWLAHAHPDLLATNNPHDLVLHIAAEFGLPAAIVVAAIVGRWLWLHAGLWKTDPAGALALACIFFLIAHSLLEYPLWHLYFLVPLGLLAGVAEPMTATPVKRQVRAHLVFVPIGVAAIVAAVVMKADYDAVAALWDGYLNERLAGRPHGPETIAGVLALKDMTYFKPQIDRLYVDLQPVSAMQGDEEIEVSGRVLSRLADVQLIERHIELLLQAGRIDETYPHIERLKIFAGSDYPLSRARIEEAIASNGAVLDPVRRALAAPLVDRMIHDTKEPER